MEITFCIRLGRIMLFSMLPANLCFMCREKMAVCHTGRRMGNFSCWRDSTRYSLSLFSKSKHNCSLEIPSRKIPRRAQEIHNLCSQPVWTYCHSQCQIVSGLLTVVI